MFVCFLVLFLSTHLFVDRMPPQMGRHISDTVYESLLLSFDGHVISDGTMACHFVDVPSSEKRKDDSFWVSKIYLIKIIIDILSRMREKGMLFSKLPNTLRTTSYHTRLSLHMMLKEMPLKPS